MEEVRKLKKYVVHVSLVYCPKSKEIVASAIACLSCPYHVSENWNEVYCSYKEG
jgi:hypothetical protein